MDISETWRKLESEKLAQPMNVGLTPGNSIHPVAKIKSNYLSKTIMLIVITIGFGGLAFYFDEILVRGIFGFLAVAYTVFVISSFSTYRKIEMDGPVLDVLAKTKAQITRALRFEAITSLMIYPFAGAAGYFAGFAANGKSAAIIFSRTTDIVMFATIVTVFTIAGYFLGLALTRKAYGNSLDQITRLIDQLQKG